MTIYSQISSNKLRTWVIIISFVFFITGVTYIYGEASGYGPSFGVLGLFMATFASVGSFYFSDKMILGMSGAKQIQKKDHPKLYRTVENLCIGQGLTLPKIYIIDDTAPNAFATGRDPKHAVVCITKGLLKKLNESELEGVMAHEISHVKNYDIRLMAIVAILVGMITFLSDIFLRMRWYSGGGRKRSNTQAYFILIGLVLALLSPLIATIIKLAVSRRREFLADASAALLTRYPDALASALEKIDKDKEPLEAANKATAHLYIVNPFKDKQQLRSFFANLFNTHPPIEERIRILRAM